MSVQVETVEGTQVRFFEAGGRWQFAGCRNVGGYKTAQDAKVEAQLQLSNRFVGPLNTQAPGRAEHRAATKVLNELASRW